MTLTIAICLLLWLVNLVVYRLHKKKYKQEERPRERYSLSAPTRGFQFIQPVVYFAVLAHILLQPILGAAAEPGAARLVFGAVLGGAGIALLLWSLRALGRNYAPCYTGELPSERVRSGPYRFVSHPIYAANILQFVALMVMLPGPILYIAFAVLLAVYFFAVRDENRSLDRAFAEGVEPRRGRWKRVLAVLGVFLVGGITAMSVLYGRYVPSQAAEQACSAPLSEYRCQAVGDFDLSYYGSTQAYPQEATPVIVLHGGPGFSGAQLLPHFSFLEAKHPLYLYDQRGSGHSQIKPQLQHYQMEALVTEIDAFRRDVVQAERVHLVGHSAGAYFAAKYAARYGEHVDRLVLVSAPLPEADVSQLLRLISLGLPPSAPVEANRWLGERVAPLFEDSVYTPGALDGVDFGGVSYATMIAVSNAMVAAGLDLDELGRIASPVLITYGARETPTTGAAAQRALDEAIPDSRVVKMEASGHWAFMEQPEEFQQTLWRFLDEQ